MKGEQLYVGLVDAVKTMVYVEGGLKSLFRGIVPSLLGMAPYAGKGRCINRLSCVIQLTIDSTCISEKC